MNKILKVIALAVLLIITVAHAQNKSEWAYIGTDGKLHYKTLPKGDKIMDFSSAGYMGGGVAIPSPEVKITLSPSAGDNADAIQSAIDKVAKMPLIKGFRGAVLLNKGIYNCDKTIRINTSGVVLRGSGQGQDGTIINMTGEPHRCLAVEAKVKITYAGKPITIADEYVPEGTNGFTVADAHGLTPGDTIAIIKPVAPAWVAFMGMDQLTRNGKKQTWIIGEIIAERTITNIAGNRITIDIPLNDNYDAHYLGEHAVKVSKIHVSGLISQVGFEHLRIVSPDQTGTIDEKHHQGINLGSGLTDGWVRDVAIYNTVNSVSVTGTRITIERLSMEHHLATTGAAKPADLNGSGSQLLFDRCTINGNNIFYFATGAKVNGPIVLLNCVFKGNGWIQPHQRWATGLLVDNCEVPGGGIDFMNRGGMGSGHGWTIGWAVAWNCKAKSYLNQQPPGAANWVIGSYGEPQTRDIPFMKDSPIQPTGIFDSHGKPVAPKSLYLEQLKERKGSDAVKAIGY